MLKIMECAFYIMLNTMMGYNSILLRHVFPMYRIILLTTTVLAVTACSSNNKSITEPVVFSFSGTSEEQSSECAAVAELAPEKSSVSYVGNIWREEVDSDAEFTQLWNQITPENAGKWGEVELTQDVMHWDRLDAAVAFAQNNNIPYKFHTLVWGANQPEWLSTLTPEQQLVEVDQWISLLAQRYPSMDQIDVVNEPLHLPPSYINALRLPNDTTQAQTQWSWVSNTFTKARQFFPNSELLLNDFNILQSNDNTDEYLNIIDQLQADSLIDGIGIQAHFLEDIDVATIRSNLDRLGSTGLPVYISEFDLNIEDDQKQLERMQQLFPIFYTSKHVNGITFWGFRENQIWLANSRLINADGSKRPAMKWLECYLN